MSADHIPDVTKKVPAVGARLEPGVGRLEPERAAYDAWYAAATFETMGREWTWAGWQAGAAWQRADMQVLACQVDGLRAALLKVIDALAKADSTRPPCAAASTAEKEARLLLATLKTPNDSLSGALTARTKGWTWTTKPRGPLKLRSKRQFGFTAPTVRPRLARCMRTVAT